jgi:hypothetical protein
LTVQLFDQIIDLFNKNEECDRHAFLSVMQCLVLLDPDGIRVDFVQEAFLGHHEPTLVEEILNCMERNLLIKILKPG